jgi:thioredoxin domain-containing protein 5
MKQCLAELILILINIKIFLRCGHCQKLGPIWDQLAKISNEEYNNIKIAKVDCTTESTLCSEQDITGYPT